MNIFKKKDDPHSWCISWNTDSVKQGRSMSNKSSFRGPFEKGHGKRAKTLLESERQHLYHIYWSLWRQLSFKKCLLEICKFLWFFVSTLTADDEYSLFNRENLTQPTQIQLSQKDKTLYQLVPPFLKYNFDFEHFQKKRSPSSVMYFRNY